MYAATHLIAIDHVQTCSRSRRCWTWTSGIATNRFRLLCQPLTSSRTARSPTSTSGWLRSFGRTLAG